MDSYSAEVQLWVILFVKCRMGRNTALNISKMITEYLSKIILRILVNSFVSKQFT